MRRNYEFKHGAASFYIVAFSTLILMIIATSFAAIIISEITRTSNDDLSQSAYDSAMAGVEDAKLAFYNYQNCVLQGGNAEGCKDIMEAMQEPDCDMVGKMLGRGDGEGPVVIQEYNTSGVGNNMQQAYTCVELRKDLSNYQATLSPSNMIKVVKTKFSEGAVANDIKKVKVSWFLNKDQSNVRYTNFSSSKGVVFPQTGFTQVATPPTISLAMIQTAKIFDLDHFDVSQGDSSRPRTDRGMVYLVPTNSKDNASGSKDRNYQGAYNGTENVISKQGLWKSNDKKSQNLPYAVYCSNETEYMCSATIELPEPILFDKSNVNAENNKRNDDTFVFVVGLPYGKPETEFMLEFFCADGHACGKQVEGAEESALPKNQAILDGVQIEVDSTGRANDLFRRVSVRLENNNDLMLTIMGPLELLESSGKDALVKDYIVTSEYNF